MRHHIKTESSKRSEEHEKQGFFKLKGADGRYARCGASRAVQEALRVALQSAALCRVSPAATRSVRAPGASQTNKTHPRSTTGSSHDPRPGRERQTVAPRRDHPKGVSG